MNQVQRLFTTAAAMVALLMVLFPPFLVYGAQAGQKWITFSAIWELPHPAQPSQFSKEPYCPEGHAFYLVLLVQLVALLMASSYIYERLGKHGVDAGVRYPEYYRP